MPGQGFSLRGVSTFTGIVETTGEVQTVLARAANRIIGIKNGLDVKPGDSVSVDGCCLTVVDTRSGRFRVEATKETVALTTLITARPGAVVNLERALRAGDRLGGHLVSGHVDEVGSIKKIIRQAGFSVFEIEVSKANSRYLVEKGSVAVDGISLTVARLIGSTFRVNIIPYTIDHTGLRKKTAGGRVNIEFDMVGKYIEKFANTEGRG